jgi:hypothetical protein
LWGQDLYQIDTPSYLLDINLVGEIVAFGDVNNDGYPDMVVGTDRRQPIVLYYDSSINDFSTSGPDTLQYNLDNSQSFYVAPMYHTDSLNHILYINSSTAYRFNSSDSTYSSVSTPTSLTTSNSRNINFGDFDREGTLDFISNVSIGGFQVNRLRLNVFELNNKSSIKGSGDITNAYESSISAYTYDFTGDGYSEYFVVNSNGLGDRYYISDAGEFKERNYSYLRESSYSFGAAIGDYDNDGDLDIYRTTSDNNNSLQNAIFINDGAGNFTKGSLGIATLDRLDSRNAMWGDMDNDGDLDLLVAEFQSPLTGNNRASCSLYENKGNGEFDKLSSEPVMNQVGNWIHAMFFDRDRDGNLDIVTFGTNSEKPVQWYTNTGNSNNWLVIELEQTNAFYSAAYGTRLTLEANIQGETVTQYREYNPFSGYLRQLPPYVHFGLGDATEATLTIEWPSGYTEEKQLTIDDLNQYQRYKEPLAGKIANSSSSTPYLEAKINETIVGTAVVQNIGQAALTIDSIATTALTLTIDSAATSIPTKEVGEIAVRFSPNNINQVGSNTDSLLIYSDAINSPFVLPIKTFALTEAPPFKHVAEPLTGITMTSDSYEYSTFFDMDESAGSEAILFRRNTTNQFYKATPDTNYEQVDILSDSEITYASSTTVGDFNLDGYQDLFVTNPGSENVLYKNYGDLQIARYGAPGINDRIKNSTSASFYDFNKDDWLDLFITNGSGQQDELLINQKGNSFKLWDTGDMAAATYPSSDHTIVDLNADSLADIVITTAETGAPSYIRVFIQEEDLKFKEKDIPNLTDLNINTTHILPFDMENDGDFDLIITTDDPERPLLIFQNKGDLQFIEFNNEAINSYTDGAPTDIAILDYNLDGYQDIFITDERFSNPNILFESIEGTDYLRITSGDIVTEDELASYGVGITDHNRNGRPDLLVTNFYNKNRLYTTELDTLHWLAIKPYNTHDDGSQSMVPGTVIEVESQAEDGSTIRQQQILGASTARSTSFTGAYFGLGTATEATVRLKYPNDRSFTHSITKVDRTVALSNQATPIHDSPAELPNTTQLYANYPNPFNPQTTLHFSLKQSQQISLSIYNTLGQRVALLADRRFSGGNHKIVFQADNLPTGVYFAVLKTKRNQYTQKLLLLK